MLMLHGFTFDPRWIRPARAVQGGTIFYDGTCGLCHRWVRFVLSEDAAGAFRLAPLDSDAFRRTVAEERRGSLPDSVVLQQSDGRLKVRSAAILGILSGMGGLWRVVSVLSGCIPRPLRDAAYNGIAAIRYRLFERPAAACPILPPHLRGRFLHEA